jgi:menaquinone-dependent protoporphyrinogen oxidase
MKILIAVGSHLGSTTGIAERMAVVLREAGFEVSVQPAASAGPVEGYEGFIVAGGTYAGRWHPDAVAFVRRNVQGLAGQPVWLFSSGPLGSIGDAAPKDATEITELGSLVNARGHAVFAGAHDRTAVEGSELSRIEKFIAKRFIPEGDWRDWPSIEAWARAIALDLKATPVNAL